jgi:hypothetical protein
VSLLAVIFLIPFFLSLFCVIKGRPDWAFLNIYLPCALLLPAYYGYRIPHFPIESASAWALLPLGASLLFSPGRWPSLRRMDLWVVLFMLSLAASELLREKSPKDGLALFGDMFVQMFFAYVVGRCLIEPNLRMATTKRIVLLFLCLTPAILFEYRMGRNPWIMGAGAFGIYPHWFVQIRSGHARVAASFGGSILAGILFAIALCLDCTLADMYRFDKRRLGTLFYYLERYHVPAVLLALFIFLTGSRGPLISATIGYLILQIPRFRNIRLAAVIVLLILGTGGLLLNSYFNRYTSAEGSINMNEEQSSAIYRRELVKNYQPVLKQGGWLGWGALSFPRAEGQLSIDNEYLLLQLAQGKLGLYLFLLMAAESLAMLTARAFTFRAHESQFFAFALLGALLTLYTSLYTVYLGEVVVQVCFLLLGWSHSLQDIGPKSTDDVLQRHGFKRVFV